MYSWPPRTSTTGLAGATLSRSRRRGSRCSFHLGLVSSRCSTRRAHPSGTVRRERPAVEYSSARERVLDRSTPGPPPGPCRWLSERPGMTVRPSRSITLVPGRRSLRTSALRPTATKRPPAIATASAVCGVATVTIFPPWRIVSGGGACVAARGTYSQMRRRRASPPSREPPRGSTRPVGVFAWRDPMIPQRRGARRSPARRDRAGPGFPGPASAPSTGLWTVDCRP